MRRIVELAVLTVGVLLGYGLGVVFGGPTGVEPAAMPDLGPRRHAEATTTPLPGTTTTLQVGTEADAPVYLVWSTGGLTPDLVDALAQMFDDVSIVRGDVVELDAGGGAVIPVDAVAIDPQSHSFFDPQRSLMSLRPGVVVLGETSAEIRGATLGDRLVLDGDPYEIVAIAPDEVIGAAEVVFDRMDVGSPVGTDRYVLVASLLPRAQLEAMIRPLYDGPAALRIRAEGETPWLRHGDAVLPQVFIKKALGEFSYSDQAGSGFVQDSGFLSEHIVDAEVPILGHVTCHETLVEMLSGAMTELMQDGLSHLVDPAGFAGCWNPRFIRPVTGTTSGVSRHAWGAAVDINSRANPVGSAGTQDPRLVETMIDWGFTWGGDWLVPDPMHFEYGVDPG